MENKKSLTADVLHGDGAGSGEFPWHPKGFVTQLLIHQCTCEETIHKESAILPKASMRFGFDDFLTDSPPSLAVFSSKWTEYKEKMATAMRRIL